MVLRSPTREPSILGDAEQDQSDLDDDLEYLVESSNAFEPPVPNQALGDSDDKSLGEFDITFEI